MNRLIRRLAVGFVVLGIAIGLGAPAVHAETVGGETWTSELRVRTVAEEIEKDKWNLEIRVFDRTGESSLLSTSITTYTDRTRQVTVEGRDQREYRFSITVRKAALESKLEIRDDGEPIEYLRSLYEREERQALTTTSESNVLRVGGRVLAPELIRRAEPEYPDEAKSYRVSGVVILEATIDETGRVTNTRVVKGLPFGLSEAAAEAVANWRYKPATMDGKPVKVAYNVSVEFNLHKAGD